MQGYVNGALGGSVSRREAVHIGEDVLHLEGVVELGKVHLVQEVGYRFHALAQVRGHGGLAVTGYAFPFQLHLDVGRSGAAVGSHGEHMSKLEFVGEELHVKLAVTFDDVKLLRATGTAQEAGAYGCQACGFQKVASILHSRGWLLSC